MLGDALRAEQPEPSAGAALTLARAKSSALALRSDPGWGPIGGEPSRDLPQHLVRQMGKYRILLELGRGGMATVYLALAQGAGGVDKLVVLKALLPASADDPHALASFLDEARLAARLNHAHVVQTYEVGSEGDRQVIVMEYLEGQALSTLLRHAESSAVPLPHAMHLRVIINVLEGLHYAHELRDYDGKLLDIVHRDISPQNVFVTYDGQVKVLDFGIAKASTSLAHTAIGVVKGKLSYMPPEQMLGHPVDKRADVYAIGCLLWAMATGFKLWKDVPEAQIMQRVLSGDIPRPSTVNPSCDRELERIVMKALAARAEDRYRTALQVQTDLEAYADSLEAFVKQKDLGAELAWRFAGPRAELRALVERQLTTASAAVLPSAESLSPRAPQRSLPGTNGGGVPVTLSALPQRDSNSRSHVALLVALLAVPVLSLGFFLRPREPIAILPGAPQAALAQRKQPPAASPAVPTHAIVHFRVQPNGAQLTLDGERLATNPASSLLPLDGKQHRFSAELEGHEPFESSFIPTRDYVLEVTLPPLASAEPEAADVLPTKAPSKRRKARASQAEACSQPFSVDARGIKRLRPECM